MSKRPIVYALPYRVSVLSLLSMFALLVLAIPAPLNAQTNSEMLQQTADPTVDAAVDMLFAQTATAEAGETVETSSTDEAAPEVQVTPQPTIDVSTLSAEIVQTYDGIMAGPTNTSAYLSPDGEKFIHVNHEELCVYSISGNQQHCATLEDETRRLDRESIAWSRDSRYAAFALASLQYYVDSDIWVYDVEENTLTNVTPDDTIDMTIAEIDSGTLTVDLSPHWTDDGRLWFVRLKSRTLGDVISIDADGENPDVVYKYVSINPYQYYLLDVTRDGSAIALTGYPSGGDGAVLYEHLADERTRSISLPERFTPSMLSFSPDGQHLLLMDAYPMSEMPVTSGAMYVLDVTTTDLYPVEEERLTRSAGWLPNQNALLYSVFDPIDEENSGLFIAAVPGEPGEEILHGGFFIPTSRNYQPIWISDQNTLLMTTREAGFDAQQIALETQ